MKFLPTAWVFVIVFFLLQAHAKASCGVKSISIEKRLERAAAIFTGKIVESYKLNKSVEGFTHLSKVQVLEKFKGESLRGIERIYWNAPKPRECDPKATGFPVLTSAKLKNSLMKFLIVAEKRDGKYFTTSELGSGVLLTRELDELRKLTTK